MLGIESEQFAEQRKLNAEQAKVLELQATELRQSLEERKRAQAARVFIGATWHPEDPEFADPAFCTPGVVNGSDFPAYDTQIWYPSDTGHAYTSGTVLPGEGARSDGAGSRFLFHPGCHRERRPYFPRRGRRPLGSGCLTAPSTSRPATRRERASWPPWGCRYPSRSVTRTTGSETFPLSNAQSRLLKMRRSNEFRTAGLRHGRQLTR